MRRPVSLILSAGILIAGLLTGCEGDIAESQIPSVSYPAAAEGNFVVGIICEGDKRDEEGFDDSHIEAIRQASYDLGISSVRIADEITDDVALRYAVEDLAEYGCDIIFDIDFDHMQSFAAASEEYPDIVFCQYGGYLHNETNLISYSGRMYQASYLTGIAEGYRALTLGTDEVLYSVREDTGSSEMNSMINAFALGVQSVASDVTVNVRIEEESEDSAVTETEDLLIYPVEDLKSFYTTAISTSMYEASASEFVTNMGGDYYGSLSDGYVGISELPSSCPLEINEAITIASDLILSGQWDVFSGTSLSFTGEAGNVTVTMTPSDIEDTHGDTVIEAGEPPLPDTVIRAYMDYFVDGVNLM